MKLLTALLLCAAVALLPGCRDGNRLDVIVGNGTILPAQAECSSWFVGADSGVLYEVHNVPAEFQQVDLRVHFMMRERKDAASVCMRGPIAEVISMTRL